MVHSNGNGQVVNTNQVSKQTKRRLSDNRFVSRKVQNYSIPDSPPRSLGADGSYNKCQHCNDGGLLVCCDLCPFVYHMECLNPPMENVPTDDWYCPQCNWKMGLEPVVHPKSSTSGTTSMCSKGNHVALRISASSYPPNYKKTPAHKNVVNKRK